MKTFARRRFVIFLAVTWLGGLAYLAGQTAVAAETTAPWAGKKVLWLGDSITQQGGYVTLVDYYLNKLFPRDNFDITSIGLASEMVSGLTEKQHPFPRPNLLDRLPRALELIKPQIVVACYGMNDGIYHPESPERFQAFQRGIGELIHQVDAAGAKLILLTPPPFDPLPITTTRPADAPDFAYFAPYTNYDRVLTDYAKWELTLNSRHVKVIDLHTPVLNYLRARRASQPDFHFAADGIHPNEAGHLLMASVVLRALGVPIPQDDLSARLRQIHADPLFDLVAQQRQTRSDGWLAYVGYTRGDTVKSDTIAPTETTVAKWQQQIDQERRTVRVACVGDSITYGSGTSDPGKYAYPAQLQQDLGPKWEVRNFGVGGATLLSHGDKPYPRQGAYGEALAFLPNIVVIALGTNDSKHRGDGSQDSNDAPDNWQYKAEFVPDYQKLVAAFRQANPEVKIYVCLPPPCFPGRWGINDQTIHQEIIPLIRRVARKMKAQVIDLNRPLAGKSGLFPDTVHPNNTGAGILAATVCQALTGRAVPQP